MNSDSGSVDHEGEVDDFDDDQIVHQGKGTALDLAQLLGRTLLLAPSHQCRCCLQVTKMTMMEMIASWQTQTYSAVDDDDDHAHDDHTVETDDDDLSGWISTKYY